MMRSARACASANDSVTNDHWVSRMKKKSPGNGRHARQSVQWDGAQMTHQWLKRLLVIHRCPSSLAQSRYGRIHPVKGVTIADAKFIGCQKTSAGEMFALYVIQASSKSFSAASARFSRTFYGNRSVDRHPLRGRPVLYSYPAGGPSYPIHSDKRSCDSDSMSTELS